VTGNFAGALEGSFVQIPNPGGVSYAITYFGGTGNDVLLTRIGRFDFNATNAPADPTITDTTNGYQQVLTSTSHPGTAPGAGFGWSGGAILAADRGVAPGALLRDMHYANPERTFSVDVV